ncbi:MAG: hypothetical protein KTR17_08230 [Cellvibrionaceae bacterium]|nr:hypothetical protein [Cellvibrionaceae bacterium]
MATIKRPLDISLAINQLAARGYFVSHRFHWTHFSLRLRANYLQLSDLTYGASWGTYEPNLTLENQTQLTVDYSYSSRETILDREVDAVAGSGWIIDFAIDWQQGKQSASFDVNEAWSRLHWRAAPASRIQGNLVDLKIRRDAALQFDEFYSEVRQTLPAHSRLSYQYQLYPRLALGINSEQLSRQRWHRVFLQTPLWDAASFTLAYAPFDKFAKLGLHTKHFYLQLESNDSDWKDARLLNASIGLSFPIF